MDRETFYLAWYTGEKNAEKNAEKKGDPLKRAKLHFLEKYWLISTPHSPLSVHKPDQGRYFHTVKVTNGSVVIGPEIAPKEAIQSSLLYTYKVNEKKEVVESSVVKKGLISIATPISFPVLWTRLIYTGPLPLPNSKVVELRPDLSDYKYV